MKRWIMARIATDEIIFSPKRLVFRYGAVRQELAVYTVTVSERV
jgi:hypothetical protein